MKQNCRPNTPKKKREQLTSLVPSHFNKNLQPTTSNKTNQPQIQSPPHSLFINSPPSQNQHKPETMNQIFLSFTLLLLLHQTFTLSMATGVKAGYWPSYLNSTFPSSSINLSYFTHIYYAFVQPDRSSFTLNITPFDSVAIPAFVASAHAHSPPVNALLTVGGGSNISLATFGEMVKNETGRSAFIGSTIEVARGFGLDGVDLDWEFPKDGEEMERFGDLVAEWRAAVEREAAASGRRKLLLSAAVYYGSGLSLGGVVRSYPAEAMGCNLDYINAMCYDYHGSWDKSQTGSPAALFDPASNISTSSGVDSWLSAGVPPQKLLMGIPLYGHTWRLRNASDNGVGAPAVDVGPGQDGIMLYSEIAGYNTENNATVVYDGATVAAYSYVGTSWIGYDDRRSAAAKVRFARAKGIGGYFFWALGYDDASWSISRSALNAWES